MFIPLHFWMPVSNRFQKKFITIQTKFTLVSKRLYIFVLLVLVIIVCNCAHNFIKCSLRFLIIFLYVWFSGLLSASRVSLLSRTEFPAVRYRMLCICISVNAACGALYVGQTTVNRLRWLGQPDYVTNRLLFIFIFGHVTNTGDAL